MKKHIAIAAALGISFLITSSSSAQTNTTNYSPAQTAVPFLNIGVDARSSAMGGAGAAIPADANANYWNPAKLSFLETGPIFSVFYTPWMPSISEGLSLKGLSFSDMVDDSWAIGSSFRYFDLGSFDLTDADQNTYGSYHPAEMAWDISASRKFGDRLSIALSWRYIFSSLGSISLPAQQEGEAGAAFATDISLYYRKANEGAYDNEGFAAGLHLSNLGTKFRYTSLAYSSLLPANLKIGNADYGDVDEEAIAGLTLDINKLLVPNYNYNNATGQYLQNSTRNYSVPAGIIAAFQNVPGGLLGQFKDLTYNAGLEFLYRNQFSLRCGFIYRDPYLGDERLWTAGAGFRVGDFNFDFSYMSGREVYSPLANTLCFTLSFRIRDTN